MQHGYPRSDPQETEPRNEESRFHYLCLQTLPFWRLMFLDQNQAYKTRIDFFEEPLNWLSLWETFAGWKYLRNPKKLPKFLRNSFKLLSYNIKLSKTPLPGVLFQIPVLSRFAIVCSVLLVFHDNLSHNNL